MSWPKDDKIVIMKYPNFYLEIGELVDDVLSVVPPRHHGVVKQGQHGQVLQDSSQFRKL
jgi:hypothetical protein